MLGEHYTKHLTCMIKHAIKSIVFLIFALLVLFLTANKVYASTVTYPTETNILLTTPNITLAVEANSSADSVTVSDSSITVTVSAPDSFVLRSDNKYNLANNGSFGINCGSSTSKLTIQPSSGTQTVIVTPTTATCTASTPTPTPSNNVSTINSSGGGGSPSTPTGCSNQSPTSNPNLFQINAMSTKVTLYFAPAGKPYSDYYISFGNGVKDEQYSAVFGLSNTTGAIYYTVNELNPNTIYSFKVRAGNGCAPGAWSKTMKIQTTSGKVVRKYYSSLISYVVSTFNNILSKVPVLNKLQTQPTVIQQQTATPTQQPSNNTVAPAQQTGQTFIPTVTPKQKTCFFFICW
jgi:hypothetical protein